jgi:lipopolysaccharide transport system permease protein
VLAAALLPWFFVTPIFLRVEDMPGVGQHPWVGDVLTWCNPVAPFIDAVRDVLFLGSSPSVGTLLYLLAAGGGALALGVAVFRRLERDLAVIV